MLILADYLIDSRKGYEIYHGDFPIVINSDDLSKLFIARGTYANAVAYKDHHKDGMFCFVVGRTKNGTSYRLSDIFAIPDELPDEVGDNPRNKACDALRDLLDAIDSGGQFYRSVFNYGGNDIKNWQCEI